jgi:hypothetical protein
VYLISGAFLFASRFAYKANIKLWFILSSAQHSKKVICLFFAVFRVTHVAIVDGAALAAGVSSPLTPHLTQLADNNNARESTFYVYQSVSRKKNPNKNRLIR